MVCLRTRGQSGSKIEPFGKARHRGKQMAKRGYTVAPFCFHLSRGLGYVRISIISSA